MRATSTLALLGLLSLPLGRFAVEGRLLRIGVEGLALDAGEAAQMAAALGRPVASEQARAVVERTEGWPAATYLALRQAGQGERGATIRGDDHDLAAYLRQELLDPLDRADRAWLRREAAAIGDDIAAVLASTLANSVRELPPINTDSRL